jgi:hypothetical protein
VFVLPLHRLSVLEQSLLDRVTVGGALFEHKTVGGALGHSWVN